MYIHGGMIMRISKWGNSLAVRLPAEVVETLGLKEGDEIDFNADPDKTHSLEVIRALTQADAIRKLRSLRGMVPADFKFNREEANER
jgi:antitoxin MazE